MDLLGIFITPVAIAIGMYIYSLYFKFKRIRFEKKVRNFIAFCTNNKFEFVESSCNRIVYRHKLDSDDVNEIENLTQTTLSLPRKCTLYEYFFVTKEPAWEEKAQLVVIHHGGIRLHHNYAIEIDGVHQPFNAVYRSIEQIAGGDEFSVREYNILIYQDKKASAYELAENIYPKRIASYHRIYKE